MLVAISHQLLNDRSIKKQMPLYLITNADAFNVQTTGDE